MTRSRIDIGFLFALFVIAAVNVVPAHAEVTVVYSLDLESGRHIRQTAYDVAPGDAIAAFAAQQSGTGDGWLYHNGGASVGSGSAMTSSIDATGWTSFLEANYEAVPPSILPPCDENLLFQYILECPFECFPEPFECDENVWISYTVTCNNQPPCPPTMICQDFPDRLTGVITDLQPCFCEPGSDFCAQDLAAVVVHLITSGPLCECVETTSTESSGWGRVKNLFR